ncbi:MAG: TIGR00159 family protein [Polyangiaceae bacterium]|nr:TIGR00159 family protein [Polyangiaceae bacterium]
MFEALERIFAGRSAWDIARDLLDIAIVAYLIYRLLLIVRGTRAMQMGVGLGVILLLYLASKSVGLITLQSMLQYVLSSIILIVVVVFQNDIRRALIRVGGQAWLGRGRRMEQSRVIDEVVAAVTELARHRIGAIIAFEQDANLLEFTKGEGTVIGAAVTRELLVALFYPESVNKLHDGAIIIRDLKIARAGVFFPMPEAKGLDASMGTRHRAALGITEETDAVVVVVSEERGTISFCFNGNIVPNLDGTALRQTLIGLLEQKPARKRGARIAATAAKVPPSVRDSTPPPPSATTSPIPATSTPIPIPRPVQASRLERARAQAARSAEPEIPHAKAVSSPMPRTTKPMPSASSGDKDADGQDQDQPPSSGRPSFVASSARPSIDEAAAESVRPRTEET